ncbi:MAG: hypothetical protein K0R39_4189 [Symbiobacteriaceae bacterium]|nr:hypothetical protein [Symbiobacteriaceae bacterium]
MSPTNELKIASHLGTNPVFRPLESVDLSRTVAAFPGLEVVGELDDVLKQPLEITMTEDWKAYLNAHVMMEAAKFYTGRITHVRFLPDQANSQIIMLQAQSEKEYGATKVEYSETESGTIVNLRQPLQKLGVKRMEGRVRSFPLVIRTGADGKEYLALTLVGAGSRPVVSKKKTQAAGGTQNAGGTAPTGTSSAPGTTAPTVNNGTAGSPVTADGASPAPSPVSPVAAAAAPSSEVAPSAQPGGGTQAPSGAEQKPARSKTK